METRLADFIRDTPDGREADAILRACVHCGFCTATCPTYQLLGDELDGPRGRIYLIKQMLEGAEVTASTQLHLDRCLSCRACETTCPSGVRYGRLADIGRHVIEQKVERTASQRAQRWLLRKGLTQRGLFAAALAAGLAGARRCAAARCRPECRPRHRKTLACSATCAANARSGVVQPALAPSIDAALAPRARPHRHFAGPCRCGRGAEARSASIWVRTMRHSALSAGTSMPGGRMWSRAPKRSSSPRAAAA
jgi:glycolate oxidase iron-sulfur subunit